jgi:hypothetical protein
VSVEQKPMPFANKKAEKTKTEYFSIVLQKNFNVNKSQPFNMEYFGSKGPIGN